jgi:two-component system, NtrC family, response regulator AtoC
MTATTLIVEDDDAYASILSRIVSAEGFQPTVATSGEEGLAMLDEVRPALALVDIGLPGIDGVEVIEQIVAKEPGIVCIVVSGLTTIENTVAAMKAGAFDIIQKTSNVPDIQIRLRKAVDMANLRRQVRYLEQRERDFGEIVGESEAMKQVQRQIEKVAAAPTSTVLVVGETGTGKELVARAIHRRSDRSAKPLVTVNCAAVPDSLLESEFFGHERGAFTGADRTKLGLFESAHGGSLFLDEIGDLDLKLQAKLLRIVEERTFKRVGGVREITVDVRLIAATNRNLEEMVAEDVFREDLLYRLNVFQVNLPPLRERDNDIMLLSYHFMRDFCRQLGKDIKLIDARAERALLDYPFPGNVRQLRNLIEQAVILARRQEITVDLLRGIQGPLPSTRPAGRPRPQGVADDSIDALRDRFARAQVEAEELERVMIARALEEAGGNKTKAADLLEMSRYALQRSLRRLDGD